MTAQDIADAIKGHMAAILGGRLGPRVQEIGRIDKQFGFDWMGDKIPTREDIAAALAPVTPKKFRCAPPRLASGGDYVSVHDGDLLFSVVRYDDIHWPELRKHVDILCVEE